MSDPRDPGRRILTAHIVELLGFMAKMQGRRGPELISAVLFGVFFAGLILAPVAFDAKIASILAITSTAVAALGQLAILERPAFQVPVIIMASVCSIASLIALAMGV